MNELCILLLTTKCILHIERRAPDGVAATKEQHEIWMSQRGQELNLMQQLFEKILDFGRLGLPSKSRGSSDLFAFRTLCCLYLSAMQKTEQQEAKTQASNSWNSRQCGGQEFRLWTYRPAWFTSEACSGRDEVGSKNS